MLIDEVLTEFLVGPQPHPSPSKELGTLSGDSVTKAIAAEPSPRTDDIPESLNNQQRVNLTTLSGPTISSSSHFASSLASHSATTSKSSSLADEFAAACPDINRPPPYPWRKLEPVKLAPSLPAWKGYEATRNQFPYIQVPRVGRPFDGRNPEKKLACGRCIQWRHACDLEIGCNYCKLSGIERWCWYKYKHPHKEDVAPPPAGGWKAVYAAAGDKGNHKRKDGEAAVSPQIVTKKRKRGETS